MNTNLPNKIKTIIRNPLIYAISLYALAWWATYSVSRLLWGKALRPLNPLILMIDFLIPLALIVIFIYLTKPKTNRFKPVRLLFVLVFLFACANLFVFKIQLMNYGDVGQLGTLMGDDSVFSRWLIGSGLLNLFLNHLVIPFFNDVNELLYVKLASCLVMCFSSIIFISRYSDRSSILLSLTTPIWLLMSFAYDEYYPFIAFIFICFMLLITEEGMQKIPSPGMGVLAAVIGLYYAGFLPLSFFLLLLYTIRRGKRMGLYAVLFSLLSAVAIVLIFYGKNAANFPTDYLYAMNLKEADLFPEQSIPFTPFFKIQYALSDANLKRMLVDFFWTGSASYLLILIIGLVILAKNRFQQIDKKTILVMAGFFLWQILYFIFMIPRLGVVTDIDLYFTVYLTLAYFAGWTIDKAAINLDDSKRDRIRVAVFSFCTGSSAFVLIYLMFLGLYALG